jgi:hypothetical protein
MPKTVGEVLYDLMESSDWKGADLWRKEPMRLRPRLLEEVLNTEGLTLARDQKPEPPAFDTRSNVFNSEEISVSAKVWQSE